MKKEINKDCSISFEIRVCEISDEDKSQSYKSKNKMVINDIEYNFIKKCLNNEYGIGDHFEDLDREVKEIIKKGVQNQKLNQLQELKQELQLTLHCETENAMSYASSISEASDIHKGWIECLEYVIETIDNKLKSI